MLQHSRVVVHWLLYRATHRVEKQTKLPTHTRPSLNTRVVHRFARRSCAVAFKLPPALSACVPVTQMRSHKQTLSPRRTFSASEWAAACVHTIVSFDVKADASLTCGRLRRWTLVRRTCNAGASVAQPCTSVCPRDILFENAHHITGSKRASNRGPANAGLDFPRRSLVRLFDQAAFC